MTHSQTIAKVFTIIGYILLVPAVIVTLFSLLTIYFAIIPIVISSLGIWLLVGYRKHSKGNLSEGKILPLWIGSIVYNVLLLAPQVWLILQTYSFFSLDFYIKEGGAGASVYFAIVCWQFIAVLLSISALWDELLTNRNIGNVP